jgi:TPR repeat protein
VNNSEDKKVALIPAPSSALAQAGPAALAMRGLRDLLASQQADSWIKKGQELWKQRSYTEAVGCFERGLKLNPNHAGLQFHLGYAYHLGCASDNGWGGPEDGALAVDWYRKAAEQGHAQAQANLGVMYLGFHVDRYGRSPPIVRILKPIHAHERHLGRLRLCFGFRRIFHRRAI